jgi:hypothetical protein
MSTTFKETPVDIIPLTESEPAEYVKPIHDIKSMDGYLTAYGKILGRKAIDALRPMHVPHQDDLPDFDLGRELFPAQAHVVAAAVKMMNNRGSGFICGEMGVGKTLIGMAAVHQHASQARKRGGYGGRYRCIVLCPDHLVGKWCREIRESIPDAVIVRFGPQGDAKVSTKKRRGKGEKALEDESKTRKAMRDTLELLAKGRDDRNGRRRWEKPEGPEFYVMGRNQAKWLSDWAGIADEQKGFRNAGGLINAS